jgi:hypothetical protein
MTGEGRFRRRLLALVGTLAVLLVAGLIAVASDPDRAAWVGGPGSLFGWAVPLTALFVIVAVTWLLLARESGDDDKGADIYVTCDSCGHSILKDWRLCPYCGARLAEWNPGGRPSSDGDPQRHRA